MEEEQVETQEPQVHDFSSNTNQNLFSFTPKVLLIFLGFIFLGLLSGFILSGSRGISTSSKNGIITSADISKGAVFGSDDTKTFNDTVSGILKKGGIDGEGAYHLVRPGGDSQNVYLTSAAVDLSLLIDKKIKVWGQTQKAQVAGWLMDVGRVEVLE